MDNQTSFNENSLKAILDLLVSIHSEIEVLKEQIAMIYTQSDPRSVSKHQSYIKERYQNHSQRLRDILSEHYGKLNVEGLSKY